MLLVNDELQNNELDTKLKEFKYNINLSEPKKNTTTQPKFVKTIHNVRMRCFLYQLLL